MQFQNLQVEWQSLPHAAETQLQPIEKAYLRVLYISWGITYAILLAAGIGLILLIDDIDHWIVLPSFLGISVVSIIATFIIGKGSFKRKAYAVREKDIIYRTGWLIQKVHVIPFSRVQHCVVQSGPVSRWYGLSSLAIFTAASNINDISIKGLKHEDAERLKEFILQQIQPLH